MNVFHKIGNWFDKSFYNQQWGDGRGWRWFSPTTTFNDYCDEVQKLDVVLRNPAMLKVIALQCDLFSLGKVMVFQEDEKLPDDPFMSLFEKPNPFQQSEQILWDFMFWTMLGDAYVFVYSKNIDTALNKIYLLEPRKIEFPESLRYMGDKLIFSQSAQRDIERQMIRYRYDDGTGTEIALENIIHIPDLSSGVGSWWKSRNRIDALYKVVANSEASLDAKNINVRYSGKFLVSPGYPAGEDKLPLGKEEREDLREKVDSGQPIWPLKSQIEIKRFVENIAHLALDESYLADYFLIGSMFNIPRDVLESYNQGATYENQEKATGKHISYSLQPKGDQLVSAWNRMFGYEEQGKEIKISWEHLPFMQVFEEQRARREVIKSRALLNMIQAGVPLEEINDYLGTGFTELNYNQNGTNTQANSSTTGAIGDLTGAEGEGSEGTEVGETETSIGRVRVPGSKEKKNGHSKTALSNGLAEGIEL